MRNILTTFDEFTGNEILTIRNVQDYHSLYIDLYNEFRKSEDSEKENINDDLVFEMELIKQIKINIDYILTLVKQYHKGNTKDKNILVDISKAIDSSIELRNKKDLIEQFVKSLKTSSNIEDDWNKFIECKKVEELDEIIEKENLDVNKTYKFIENAFKCGEVPAGIQFSEILPPISRFSPNNAYVKKRGSVLKKIIRFFERFFDISSREF